MQFCQKACVTDCSKTLRIVIFNKIFCFSSFCHYLESVNSILFGVHKRQPPSVFMYQPFSEVVTYTMKTYEFHCGCLSKWSMTTTRTVHDLTAVTNTYLKLHLFIKVYKSKNFETFTFFDLMNISDSNSDNSSEAFIIIAMENSMPHIPRVISKNHKLVPSAIFKRCATVEVAIIRRFISLHNISTDNSRKANHRDISLTGTNHS